MIHSSSKNQSGFTLVELIVVIVILGILAATALPKFINVSSDARKASLNGLAGSMRSAVSIVQAKHFAEGDGNATVTMADGSTVAVVAATGVPTAAAAGIRSALSSFEGFTPNTAVNGVTKFDFDTAIVNCSLTYDDGTTNTTNVGKVVVTDSGC